jgi:hypothetical protein
VDDNAILRAVNAIIDDTSRMPDGWTWAWPCGMGRAWDPHRDDRYPSVAFYVDRDRCPRFGTQPDPQALARDVERRFALQHSAEVPLRCQAIPTTRIEYCMPIVEDLFAAFADRDIERMTRSSSRWVSYRGVTRVVGWTPDGDRLRVELHAESSEDEGAAAALGREWLAELEATAPTIAALVEIAGTSH